MNEKKIIEEDSAVESYHAGEHQPDAGKEHCVQAVISSYKTFLSGRVQKVLYVLQGPNAEAGLVPMLHIVSAATIFNCILAGGLEVSRHCPSGSASCHPQTLDQGINRGVLHARGP